MRRSAGAWRGEPHRRASGIDARFAPLLEPAATLADAFRIANEIYSNDELPRGRPISRCFRRPICRGAAPMRRGCAPAGAATTSSSRPRPAPTAEKEQSSTASESQDERRRTRKPASSRTAASRRGRRLTARRSGSSRRRSCERTQTPERQRSGQRQGHALSGMGLPRGALQAQLELGAGEAARRIQHGRDQPPDEAVRDGAEAAEESHPVAEADAAGAAGAAVRRRRHGPQRRDDLRRRKTRRHVAASRRSTGGAKSASARSR